MKYITIEVLASFATKLSEKIATIFVKKESGKGLSSNDYTTVEKTKLGGMSNYTHPVSGVTAGKYKIVNVNLQGHVTGGENPTTLAGFGIVDAAAKGHLHGNEEITGVDASKLSGMIDIERLPHGALERCVVVANDAARFALTPTNVQTGDTVKVTTGGMYFVKDQTKLNSEAGYEPYTSGAATAVPWTGVSGKPATFPPATHGHTWNEVTGKPITFAPEIHSHTAAQVTDLLPATDVDIDNILAGLF